MTAKPKTPKNKHGSQLEIDEATLTQDDELTLSNGDESQQEMDLSEAAEQLQDSTQDERDANELEDIFGYKAGDTPTFTFTTGLTVELKGVPVMGLQYAQSNEIGKPVAPTRWSGQGMPIVPDVLNTDTQEYEPDFNDPEYIKRYDNWVRSSHKKRKKPWLDNPQYIIDLEEWTEKKSMQLVRYLIVQGVVDYPPTDVWDEALAQLGMEATETDVKYYWIINMMKTTEDISKFYQAVLGVTMPTIEGMQEAGDSFPDDSERNSG